MRFGIRVGTVIPEGERAVVTNWFGKRRTVEGHARVTGTVAWYKRKVLSRYDAGTVIDEKGNQRRVQGPQVMYIHPDAQFFSAQRIVLKHHAEGTLIDEDGNRSPHKGPRVLFVYHGESFHAHEMVPVAEHEAVVVITEDGAREIREGKEHPMVFLQPGEMLHTFVWSGDGEEKRPGGLKFKHLRIQDDQMYWCFKARTSDQLVVQIHLIVFWRVVDIYRILTTSSDPIGAVLNKLYAALTTTVAGYTFEEFARHTQEKLQACELVARRGDAGNVFSRYGMEIQDVHLRHWEVASREAQAILDRAGTITTETNIAVAQHDLNMLKLSHRAEQLEREQTLADKEHERAHTEGMKRGRELAAAYAELTHELSERTACDVLMADIAARGGGTLILGNVARDMGAYGLPPVTEQREQPQSGEART